MKKFLVIQTASIGDVILATPLLEKIHYSIPDARIDFLVKKGMEGLFTGHPYINELLVWNKSTKKYRNYLSLLANVRKNRYDIVINIQRFAATGILTAFSGAKTTIGFKKNPFSIFFTKRIEHIIGNDIHEVQRNLELFDDGRVNADSHPRLYPAEADEVKIASYKTGRYYTVSPASLWFTKQYPEEKWVEFISSVDAKVRIYFLGSAHDRSLCESIIQSSGHPGAVNLAGTLSFLESAALMKYAKMNFTNDSAPMHLASAVNAPVTAIFCSTVPAFGFGPLSDDSTVVEIKEPLYCRPCGLHGFNACPEKHFKCAMMIRPGQLVDRL
jgi:ADP-heptose:LPS heptosyltransferase